MKANPCHMIYKNKEPILQWVGQWKDAEIPLAFDGLGDICGLYNSSSLLGLSGPCSFLWQSTVTLDLPLLFHMAG
jgi:hypothetical protein